LLIRRPRRFRMPPFSKGHVDIRRTATYMPGPASGLALAVRPTGRQDSGARTGISSPIRAGPGMSARPAGIIPDPRPNANSSYLERRTTLPGPR